MNMKLLVVLCLVAGAYAAPAPQQYPQEVQILRYDNDNNGINAYRFAFEQSDGTKREEQGQLKNEGSENESLAVQGSYAWRGPDGVDYLITYIADENGFQPQIQQGPGGGVPPAVVASLLG